MALRLLLTDGDGVQGLTAVFGAYINTAVAETAADAAAAASSALHAADSATQSAQSATDSANSASASASSASASAGSASAAAGSASTAATQATNAANSASAASGSASAAAGSATAASGSASAAATSATAAAGSATAAATSAANAASTLASALVKTNNLSDVASATTALANLGGLAKSANLSDVANAATARGNLSAAKSGANSDITSLTGLTTPLAPTEGGSGVNAPIPVAQCYLANDATTPANVTLSRRFGRYITINGTNYLIPSAGVTAAPSGLTTGSAYNIYVYDSGSGVLALEISTTAYTLDSNSGFQIKTGDPTRVLVGRAVAASATSFAGTVGNILVISYFNRRKKTCSNSSAGLTSASHSRATFANIGLIGWKDEVVEIITHGTFHDDTPNIANFGDVSRNGVVITLTDTVASATANYQFLLSPGTILTSNTENLDSFTFNIWCNAGTIIGDGALLIGATSG